MVSKVVLPFLQDNWQLVLSILFGYAMYALIFSSKKANKPEVQSEPPKKVKRKKAADDDSDEEIAEEDEYKPPIEHAEFIPYKAKRFTEVKGILFSNFPSYKPLI